MTTNHKYAKQIAWVWLSIRQMAIVLLCFYAALLIFLYCDQRNLIFAGTSRQGARETTINPATANIQRVLLRTASNVAVSGFFAKSASNDSGPNRTVLFFYGNGNCANDCWDIVNHFQALGCSVMVVDYPGYGMSGGVASDRGCYEAADAAYRYVRDTRHIAADRIVVAGWSLGSAVAIHLAAHQPVGGLATFSAFTTMADMASREYPIVPQPIVKLLLKYPFPSQDTIKRVRCPVFIAHGVNDTFVPPQMANRLQQNAGGPVKRILVAGAAHNDIMEVGGDAMYNEIGTWMAQVR